MFNSYVLTKAVSVVISCFSQVLLKKSALKKYDHWIREYLNWRVILAYVMFFGSTLIGVYSLKGITISLSTIIESLSYILVPIFSLVFFKERISRKSLIGIMIVIIGIIIFNIQI